MSASSNTTSKKPCVTCNKSCGIFICDGCKQSFCGKHANEHRQELGVQLDCLMQEHDSFQQELEQPLMKDNTLLQNIDQWEKESIEKIQLAAQTAREALREVLVKSKEQLTKVCGDIRKNLHTTREADDFSETDLLQWKEQLKELQVELQSSGAIKLTYDTKTAIRLIKLVTKESTNDQKQEASNKQPPPPPIRKENWREKHIQEQFLQHFGPVNIEENGYLIKHVGFFAGFAYVRGKYLYSKGCYTTRFKIEQYAKPYRIFFGCMTSKEPMKENVFKSTFTVGWFGSSQVYEHGRCTTNCKMYGYHSSSITTNDELCLILDCDSQEIRLIHERTQMTCKLPVNIELAPFPWQFLAVLSNPGDSLRILPGF